MADYQRLIDAQTWAFIRRTEAFYPPETVSFGIAEQRAVYDRMCRAFAQGIPEGLPVRDAVIAGVPVRWYEPVQSGPVVVYFHGGGFVVGGLDSHDDVCADLAHGTGVRLVSVAYRLCPEHGHPAQFEDCMRVVSALDGPLVLVGDSAGGNLAAAVAHARRGEILGQVLIYPVLGGDMTRGSYIEHAEAPLLTRAELEFYEGIRCSGEVPRDDPAFAPLADQNFAGLPPSVVFSAECDPLCDDGRDYVEAVKKAGGQAHWVCETGLVHGYLRARSSVGRAKASFARIVEAVGILSAGDWTF